MQQLKLILVTVVLTFVIWSTADQLLTDVVDATVTVRPVPGGDPRMIVETVPAGQDTFKVRLEGPRRIVEQIRQEGLDPVGLPVREQPTGVYRIDVLRELAAYPEPFRGLRVVSVEPSHVQVAIDRLVTETMPVVVRTGALEYEVPATAKPAEVEVTVRQSVLDTLDSQDRRVYVEVESLLVDRPEGVALEIPGVPIDPTVGGRTVSLSPSTVTIQATLLQKTKTATIAAVPVHVAAGFDLFNRFRIETRDGSTLITRAISVSGPAETVDRLTGGTARVSGLIVLTAELAAIPGEFHELAPVFDLPLRVRLTAPVAPVEFRLVPIEESVAP